jgi:hypothetical protein
MRLGLVDVYLLIYYDVPRGIWDKVEVHHLDNCMLIKEL